MNRAWSNKFTDQQIIDTWLDSFYPLICLFSQPCSSSNHLNTFSFIWFLLKTSHNQSCALLKWSPPATMCPTPPRWQSTSVQKELQHCLYLWRIHTLTQGQRFPWDSPGTGPDKVFLPLSLEIMFLPAMVSLHSTGLMELGLWWADRSCDGSDSSQGRVLFGVPLPLLFFCALLSACRQALNI